MDNALGKSKEMREYFSSRNIFLAMIASSAVFAILFYVFVFSMLWDLIKHIHENRKESKSGKD